MSQDDDYEQDSVQNAPVSSQFAQQCGVRVKAEEAILKKMAKQATTSVAPQVDVPKPGD